MPGPDSDTLMFGWNAECAAPPICFSTYHDHPREPKRLISLCRPADNILATNYFADGPFRAKILSIVPLPAR